MPIPIKLLLSNFRRKATFVAIGIYSLVASTVGRSSHRSSCINKRLCSVYYRFIHISLKNCSLLNGTYSSEQYRKYHTIVAIRSRIHKPNQVETTQITRKCSKIHAQHTLTPGLQCVSLSIHRMQSYPNLKSSKCLM